jgi:23S rRNA (pseudouridine1915-N3)-methyltransferase
VRHLHLIVIGKLKDQHLMAIEADYLKRMREIKLEVIELKAHGENSERESQEIRIYCEKKQLPLNSLCLFDEGGPQQSSIEFSSTLFKGHVRALIIGGATGHHFSLKSECSNLLSLGTMTFPHKLCRILAVEQIYRAETIHLGHPYHNS